MSEPALSRRRLLSAAPAWAAVAALPSLTEEPWASPVPPLPAPLPADVFRARQERLRAEARKAGLDALFLVPSTNLAYAANLDVHRSERLIALVLPVKGPAVLVAPFFEEARVRRDAVADDVLTWREEEDPFALVTKALGKNRRVGIGVPRISIRPSACDGPRRRRRPTRRVFSTRSVRSSPRRRGSCSATRPRAPSARSLRHRRGSPRG